MPYSHRPLARPRLIGLTMVKNEQDIIEPMIRHNAALLDVLILLDNGSVDETRIIAMSLARELGNVVVTESAAFGYTQGERLTRLLHAAQSSYFADFVLFLDADEFIGATSRKDLQIELGKIPPNGFGGMTWHNFVLTDGATIVDPPHGLTQRPAETRPTWKAVLRLDGAFQPDLVVSRGSHAITQAGKLLPRVLLPNLPLWHFPIRGRAQITAKALVGWLACLAANPRAFESAESNHWQAMFRHIVDRSGVDATDLRSMSIHYGDPRYVPGTSLLPEPPTVHDPAPIQTSRRYSTGAFLDPLILLARSWEQALQANDPLFAPAEASPAAVIDIPPFRFLYEKYQFSSVLDVDCGIGLDLELFGRLGVKDLAGVGRLPQEALKLRQGGYVCHDDPAVGFSLGRKFALVLCMNVAADLSPAHASTVIGNADRHAMSMIGFSLNEPSSEHLAAWLERWRAMGWVPDLMETLALRCLSSTASLRRGFVILSRIAASPPAHAIGLMEATTELLAIARRPFESPKDATGVHDEPLLDAAEASWLGYEVRSRALSRSLSRQIQNDRVTV